MGSKQRSAQTTSLPPPIGGWNARDPLADMDPRDAVSMENFNPETTSVKSRAGFDFDVAIDETPEFAMEYLAMGTRLLIVAGGGEISSVATDGTVTSLGTGFTSDRWQAVNFNGHMILVNGEDAPQDFDGSSLSAAGFTGSGLTPSDLIGVTVHQNRLYFIEKDSQDFWYAALNAITGTVTKFPLSLVHGFGGDITCLSTWNLAGSDESISAFIVFVMQSGDTVVYEGTDPAVIADWSLKGVYRIPPPLTVRGIGKFQQDLIVMTRGGFISMSSVIQKGSAVQQLALTDKIRNAITAATAAQPDAFGWEFVFWSSDNKLIFNVPINPDLNSYEQYVLNTITGSWTRWTGMNIATWAIFQDKPYFVGYDTGPEWNVAPWDEELWGYSGVFEYDVGFDDVGGAIPCDSKTAYNYFQLPGNIKQLTLSRPNLVLDSEFDVVLGYAADFSGKYTRTILSVEQVSGSLWDVSSWDVTPWAVGQAILNGTQMACLLGYSFSTSFATQTQNEGVEWFEIGYVFKPGGVM